jgi:hypothetical protein
VLIRDVAYSMLPKSVRCRKHVEVAEFIRERAGERSDGVIGLIAEHFARAAALGSETGLDRDALVDLQAKALDSLEAAGDAAAALYSNAEAFDRYTSALEISDSLEPGIIARIGEKQGDVALRMGRVDAAVGVWERSLDYHRAQEDLARVADLHRKIGAALWHKGERRASIDNYQRGIDLLKDGPPCIELVRLYEEAASLYMHTGDNMLAIYASEKRSVSPSAWAPGGGAAARRRFGPAHAGRPRGRWAAATTGAAAACREVSRSPGGQGPPSPESGSTSRARISPSTKRTGRRSRRLPRQARAWPSARASTASSASRT